MLEDLCLNLITKVQEDLPFVLQDLCLDPEVSVLETDHNFAGSFVHESARNIFLIRSICAVRFVAESKHVRAGVL